MSGDIRQMKERVGFLMELDRLKSIVRRSLLSHEKGRLENSGEHSWHVSVMAMAMVDLSNEPVDLLRVLKMLLIHDIVEIDAGDTYIYDPDVSEGEKWEKEKLAAERIFGLLPLEIGSEFKKLWYEFEEKESAEAKFAGACDRLIPLLHNFYAQGHSWQEHGIPAERVYEINRCIADGSNDMWDYAKSVIEESIRKGYL